MVWVLGYWVRIPVYEVPVEAEVLAALFTEFDEVGAERLAVEELDCGTVERVLGVFDMDCDDRVAGF